MTYGMRVRSSVKAGLLAANHNDALQVRSSLRAGAGPGKIALNHGDALQVKSALKAGGANLNHNEALRS
jgi:hypothetical protein